MGRVGHRSSTVGNLHERRNGRMKRIGVREMTGEEKHRRAGIDRTGDTLGERWKERERAYPNKHGVEGEWNGEQRARIGKVAVWMGLVVSGNSRTKAGGTCVVFILFVPHAWTETDSKEIGNVNWSRMVRVSS